jgi:hypothetical protein
MLGSISSLFEAGPSISLETPLLGTGKTDLFPEGGPLGQFGLGTKWNSQNPIVFIMI